MKVFQVMIVAVAATSLAGAASGDKTIIEGKVLVPPAVPITQFDIRISSGTREWSRVHPDRTGTFTVNNLPVGEYTVSVHYKTATFFSAGHIRTRSGDPFQLTLDPLNKRAAMKMVGAKRPRYFAWVDASTGTQLDGRWVEVNSMDGTRPSGFERIDRASYKLGLHYHDGG